MLLHVFRGGKQKPAVPQAELSFKVSWISGICGRATADYIGE
jgi:hypothetical protein